MRQLFTCFIALCCLTATNPANAQNREAAFQRIVDSVYAANPEAIGIVVHVELPDQKISWSYAAGHSDKNSLSRLDPGQPALIASNTKTYVAAAILKLIEAKHFVLDDPIQQLISDGSRTLMEAHGYKTDSITVRQLLAHTSGITDYVNDEYLEFVNRHPDHKWTRDEQIALAMETGGSKSQPGEKYSYTDIEYLLLTEIIERFTNKPFYTAIGELLDFKRIGLKTTWFINLQSVPTGSKPLVHQFWSKFEWDSYKLDPSWDLYGGGGLASTAKDLALFFQALFEGRIIKDKALIEAMHTLVLPREESNYCLGVRNLLFDGDTTAYYHGGFWGTDAMYVPSLNASIAVFTLQRDVRKMNAQIASEIMKVMSK